MKYQIDIIFATLFTLLYAHVEAATINLRHSPLNIEAKYPRTNSPEACPATPNFFLITYRALNCPNSQSLPGLLGNGQFAHVGVCVQVPGIAGDLVPSIMAVDVAFEKLGKEKYILHVFSGRQGSCEESETNKDTQIELTGGTGSTACKNVIGGGYAYMICPDSGCSKE